MRKALLIAAVLLLWAGAAEARERAFGFCEQGNRTVSVSGLSSTPKVMGSYPLCTVTVYLAGTSTKATIYSDNSGTPLANPFTASSTGWWFWYADDGRYDVTLSGTLPSPWTIGDILLSDVANPSGTLIVDSISTPQTCTGPGPVQISSIWYPCTASGVVTPPAAAPVYSVVLSGGSIADGTYYYKFTYKNLNGETTVSPAATIVVAGGGGAATIYAGDAGDSDFGWATGAYGYRAYFSTDNITFHLQTANPVTADFMVNATTHYVRMGSGHKLTSLTFASATPPSTNTAVIDPIQVAMNQTLAPNFATGDQGRIGTVFVPAAPKGGLTTLRLTTPLILTRGQRLIGSSTSSSIMTGATQTDLVNTAAWANPTKLAVVMNFGGDASLENVAVRGYETNPFMLAAGTGYQAGFGGTHVTNSALSVLSTAALYSAFVGVGTEMDDVYFDNVSMEGDRSIIEYRNIYGSGHYFRNGRWNGSHAAGTSFIRNVPGWLDPDAGTGSTFFPNGIANMVVENIRTEAGGGIFFDCVNLSIKFSALVLADPLIAVGTDSIAKFGKDASFGYGMGSVITMADTGFGTSANARVGTNWVGEAGSLFIYGQGNIGYGTSTGSQQSLDMNSLAGMFIVDENGGIGSRDPNAAATTPHPINLHAQTYITAIGDKGGGSGVAPWNMVMGQLMWGYKNGTDFDSYTNLFGFKSRGDAFDFDYYSSGTKTTLASISRLGLGGNWNFTNPISIGTTPATTGAVRLESGAAIYSRDSINSVNYPLIKLGTTDLVEINPGLAAATKIWHPLNLVSTITNYNSIATVAGGVPAEYAAVDLTAQTAAKTTTTLYAVPASGAGQYRLSWNAKVTTVASTGAATSTLGALTIVYTDPDGVVQTITAPASVAAGTIATLSTGNTTTTVLLGLPLLLNCKLSTNVTYAFAYVSDTAAQMAYNLHLVLEKL